VSKRKKRLLKIRQNPKAVSFDDLRKVLEDFGFEAVRSKGSHFAFRHPVLKELFVLPYRKPHVKPEYVDQFVSIVDTVLVLLVDEEGDDE